MTKLTTEVLKEIIGSYPEDSDEIECVMARQLLAYEQAAEHPAARITWDGSEFSVSNVSEDFLYGGTAVYLAPVLPKQPVKPVMFIDGDISSDDAEKLAAVIREFGNEPAPAQPVIPEQTERERIRREHAEWSDATFGNVGPVGPLKHLSKEALEAAADPDDLLEWADMQFLLWDAQRRMGIPDDFITIAMIEKLEINKKRQWPEPKDGEPRLHINTQSAQPVIEPKPLGYFSYGSECGFDWHKTEKEAIESAEAAIDDYRGDACDGWSEETDSVCWGVILQQATKVDERPRTDDDKCDPAIDTVCDYALIPELVGNSPVIPEGWMMVPIEPTAEMAQAARDCHEGESFLPYSIYRAMLAAAPAQESE